MPRLNSLPENRLVERLAQLRQEFNDIKTSQRAGSTNLQPSRIVTGNTVDIAATVTFNTISIWEITYTPISRPFSTSGFLWRMFYNATFVSGTANFLEVVEQLPGETSAVTQQLYMMGRQSGQNTVLNIKMVIYAVGNGTISISQIQ